MRIISRIPPLGVPGRGLISYARCPLPDVRTPYLMPRLANYVFYALKHTCYAGHNMAHAVSSLY